MNTRCYRCGNSFSLSREVIEGAVAAAGPDDKVYVAYCPRCRTANKVPLQQLRRTLPVGWTPPATEPAAETAAPVAEAAPPAPEPPAAPAAEAETAPAKTTRKRASKTVAAQEESPAPEASPAAKKASRSKAKPSS